MDAQRAKPFAHFSLGWGLGSGGNRLWGLQVILATRGGFPIARTLWSCLPLQPPAFVSVRGELSQC